MGKDTGVNIYISMCVGNKPHRTVFVGGMTNVLAMGSVVIEMCSFVHSCGFSSC